MIKVGKQAPNFSCEAVINGQIKSLTLSDFSDSYKLIFFYPLDFTFVCPTELHGLQENKHEFDVRNVVILAASIDSIHSHLAWLKTPKSEGGIAGITYPLLSDIHKTIAASYGVLNEEVGVALRGVFLLDKNNVVQYMSVNNLALGRSIEEILRVIDSVMHVEKVGEVCPINWSAGKQGMKPTIEGVTTYFKALN